MTTFRIRLRDAVERMGQGNFIQVFQRFRLIPDIKTGDNPLTGGLSHTVPEIWIEKELPQRPG